MARPVKWSRDLHPIRQRAARARTETWSRVDIEELFGLSRASAQTLMKAVSQVEVVGDAHFVERPALLAFLDEMIAAPSVEEALRQRVLEAEPAPRPKTLRVSLPEDLRRARLPDLPANITLETGRLEIRAATAVGMLESLLALAMVMQNDLDRFAAAIEPASAPAVGDEELRGCSIVCARPIESALQPSFPSPAGCQLTALRLEVDRVQFCGRCAFLLCLASGLGRLRFDWPSRIEDHLAAGHTLGKGA